MGLILIKDHGTNHGPFLLCRSRKTTFGYDVSPSCMIIYERGYIVGVNGRVERLVEKIEAK